jgi:hypothetical protein
MDIDDRHRQERTLSAMQEPIEIGEEIGAKRTFVWAVDWPGWCRAGKTADMAREALLGSASRYAIVAERSGLDFPDVDVSDAVAALHVVVSVSGGGGTDFGVPSEIIDDDRRPVTTPEASRLRALVAAAWETFDRVASSAPAELRKGPRGGGRDRDKMIDHVIGADHAYAREIGVRMPAGSLDDRAAVDAERAAVLDVLGRPSDGSPLADRRWTTRYAARRIAWHALDHAWEMEDRSDAG